MSNQQAAISGRVTLGRAVAIGGAASVLDAPFPKLRTLHWVPEAAADSHAEQKGNPPDTVDLVITQEVLLAVSRHVARTLERELGGFLLGNRYRCPDSNRNYVIIDQYMEADYTEGTEVSLSFTNESWAHLYDHISGKFMGKLLVGWYHSHPKLNVYLSALDVELHQGRFPESWKSALVLEPESHQGGFFRWTGDKLDRNNYVDFYELVEGESRETVVAWSNYKGIDPKTNTTPRLKRVNTKGVVGEIDYGSGEFNFKPSELPEQSNSSGRKLRKNPLIVLGVLIILSLAAALAALKLNLEPVSISESTNPTPAPTATATAEDVAPTQRLEDTTLRNLKLDVEGVPKVDFLTARINVQLKVSQIPADAVRSVREGMKVKIDEQEASVALLGASDDGFILDASTELQEKITSLVRERRNQEVMLLAQFDHNDDEALIEKRLLLNPVIRGGEVKVRVGVRNEGKKTIRKNQGEGKTQGSAKTGQKNKDTNTAAPEAEKKDGAQGADKSGKADPAKKKKEESLTDKILNLFRGKRGKGS